MYFYIEPEVSGGFGEQSTVDTAVHPPEVSKLHYRFDGWLGDDLLETFPCYIVTSFLAEVIESSELNGYVLDEVVISTSEQFEALYPQIKLPKFYWLKVLGIAGKDDFGIADDYRLVVSDNALAALKKGKIDSAEIEDF
ncbi:hypothetical protein VR7878_02883 [Vibrio ruber DSM 16370]|uniref:Uncharacterized protein n=1 Tax=Vibrio ruber (strain DSM 16370 / JCM 11486 / BCRC 17186 / CECT 7878 / LMG 23124 / VR1) TaxID=1123498 RepID=A0A1R4LPU7_VIBR1|nr:hypothetical protein [Vibrio ruber]SJN58498.1 hypothetical protein VR7878_02883 [Vibrio ruber DSM 16370]